MADQQRCDYCGGAARFAAGIEGQGREPAHQVFYCETCQRHTWRREALPNGGDNDSWHLLTPALGLTKT